MMKNFLQMFRDSSKKAQVAVIEEIMYKFLVVCNVRERDASLQRIMQIPRNKTNKINFTYIRGVKVGIDYKNWNEH